jgi:hypothetical protein
MSFSFKEKTEALDWDAIARVDLDRIAQTTDIDGLESILQNVANAKLTRSDLKKFGDKNMIKLFKVGQLTTEYLLFA